MARRLYKLNHRKHGVGGMTFMRPDSRKQDRRAKAAVMYAVVFFPKISGIGKAHVDFY